MYTSSQTARRQPCFRWRALPLLAACSALLAMVSPAGRAAPSDAARHAFESLAQSLTNADGIVYDVHDDGGNEMDCVKIIANPNGGYLGVYHTYLTSTSIFVVSLGSSTDLIHWHFLRQLGQHASQPVLFPCSNGAFLLAWEQDPKNHIQLRYFTTISDLLNGVVSNTYDVPRNLSPYAEGTPNIYSVSFTTRPAALNHSMILIGGHYYKNHDVDRQMQGTLTNFSTWREAVNDRMNNAVLYWGVQGNIGQRDSSLYGGYRFGLVEGDLQKGNWADWNIYCYDYQTGNAEPLSITTNGGSESFANPHWTPLTGPSGQPIVVFSLFLPSEGAAPGEAGPVIYYKKISP